MDEFWCFWTVVLERTLGNPLVCKEIKPVHPKGNQSWIFIGRTDAEDETPLLWPPDAKNWLIWKDPDAGNDRKREEKGTTEDEIVGWHHQLNGHEFKCAPGVGDGQGGLACSSPWGRRVGHDWATEMNWTEWKTTVAPCYLSLTTRKLRKFNQSWNRWLAHFRMTGTRRAPKTAWNSNSSSSVQKGFLRLRLWAWAEVTLWAICS